MSVFLPQVVGVRKAKEMSLSGNFMGAHEAFARGLVNHVVAHDALLPAAQKLAADIVGNDQAAVRSLKKLYDANAKVTVGAGDRPGAGVLPRLAHRPCGDRAPARGDRRTRARPAMTGGERFESHMSDSDALMWNIEKDPLLRSTIVTVLLLDRSPDWKRLVDKIERGTWLIPRMRQRDRDAVAPHGSAAVVR